jgi:hypothetical protein
MFILRRREMDFVMRIVVLKAPGFLKGLLRAIFKIK